MWEVSMAGTSSSGTWNLLGFLCSSNRCAQGHVCRQWNPLEQLLLWVWSQEHLLSLVPERATCNACWRRLRWQAPLLPSYQWFCWNTTLTLNQLQWNGRLWENKLPPNISLTSFPLVALLVSLLGFMGHFVLFFFLLLLILILVPPGVVLSEDSSHEFSDGNENWDRDLTVFSLLFPLLSSLVFKLSSNIPHILFI